MKAGTPKTYVDLSDVIDGDGHNGNNGALVDGNKASVFTGSTITSNLTVDGQPTVVSGFELYHHRAGSTFAKNVTILIKKTADGDFEEIGTFATNWEDGAIQDSVFVDFDQSYAAYELKVVLDVWGYVNEFAVYQYEGAVAPEDPTDPSVPEETEPLVLEPSRLQSGVMNAVGFGYYDADGSFTEFTSGSYVTSNITDGNMWTLGCSDYYTVSELVQHGGTKRSTRKPFPNAL